MFNMEASYFCDRKGKFFKVVALDGETLGTFPKYEYALIFCYNLPETMVEEYGIETVDICTEVDGEYVVISTFEYDPEFDVEEARGVGLPV